MFSVVICLARTPLQAALAIEPSSGASIGVTASSLQLARSGNRPKRYIYIYIYIYIYTNETIKYTTSDHWAVTHANRVMRAFLVCRGLSSR
jgi:hypothetical protein